MKILFDYLEAGDSLEVFLDQFPSVVRMVIPKQVVNRDPAFERFESRGREAPEQASEALASITHGFPSTRPCASP